MQTEIYDYIIVGAGSSGCVLAEGLSAHPAHRVLLVESGPDDTSPMIRMPRGIGKLLVPGNAHVWDYQVSPGGNAAPEVWLKGRAVGGSSAVNGMVYVRGAPADYDNWAALGCEGWGWDVIGRCFVALEDHVLGAAEWRGVGGPIPVTIGHDAGPLTEAVLAAAEQMGTPRVEDVNTPEAVKDGGVGLQTRNIKNGKRVSAAEAFLKPARKRPNLEVLPLTKALRIEIEDGRATGLTIRDEKGVRMVRGREIIISAGAVESPKLLQLSGVGPVEVLEAAGVPVKVASPNVGRNLREHRYLQTVYQVVGGSLNHAFGGLGLLKSLFEYAVWSKGALTHSAHEAGGFFKSTPDLDHADVQLGVSLYSLTATEKGVAPDAHPGLTILGYFTRPESQGELHIVSADPDERPVINANHFSAEIDRKKAVALFRWLRELGKKPALAPWIVKEQAPGPSIESDEDILMNAVALGGTSFHISGTCRMGADPESVLDPQLRVRGVENLRVADTSIMPTLVSGNTNAPAMVIGMRAVQLILDAR